LNNQIIWHCLPNESPDERDDRINKDIHRIFFDGKDVCPERFLQRSLTGDSMCRLCDVSTPCGHHPKHGTPRFLESLDAMQLIVESGKFAEVREEFFHWLARDGKPPCECRILLYRQDDGEIWFQETGNTRQEAFYCAALKSQGYTVIKEDQGENNV